MPSLIFINKGIYILRNKRLPLAGASIRLCQPTPLENSTTYEMRIGDWAKGLYFVEVRE